MCTTTEAVLACQVSRWFDTFRHLCYPRRLLPLPRDFVDYLTSDRVFAKRPTRLFREEAVSDDSTSDSIDSDAEEPFPEILSSIQALIEELGGTVVPKLNWSAPRDAVWLSPEKQLKCTCAEEVVLFLRSSDRIAHDICTPFDGTAATPETVEYVLSLSKFHTLMPQSEYRCFVKCGRLVGISQRDVSQFFPQIAGEEDRIRRLSQDWFLQYVQLTFPLKQYSFDVYVTRQDRIKLLDFNPICVTSSPLLFSWAELGLDPENQSPEDGGQTNAKDTRGRDCVGEAEVPVRFVQDDGAFMMGATFAVSMPYDMVGCSLTEALEKMQNAEHHQN